MADRARGGLCRLRVVSASRTVQDALTHLAGTLDGFSATGGTPDEPHQGQPDLVVVDLRRPEDRPMARRCRAGWPHARLVLLVAGPEQWCDRFAREVGATGWASWAGDGTGLARALDRARRGATLVPPLAPAPPPPDRGELGRAGLTPRETEVLRLVTLGQPSTTIAGSLGISAQTVRTHLQSVMAKLDVHSRLAAAAVGRRAGLGGPLALRTEAL